MLLQRKCKRGGEYRQGWHVNCARGKWMLQQGQLSHLCGAEGLGQEAGEVGRI